VLALPPDNGAYLRWTSTHPAGYVLNIQRTLNPSDARLHRAPCRWINGEPPRGGGFIGFYIKVCSESLPELTAWAGKNAGAEIRPCGTCQPLPRPGATARIQEDAPAPRQSQPCESADPDAGTARPAGAASTSLVGSQSWRASIVTEAELELLAAACRQLEVRPWPYEEHDYITNVLLTVLDLQMHNVAVERSIRYYRDHRRDDIATLHQLEDLLARFHDDREGNRQVATYLWGNDLWTRASWLRGLAAFLVSNGLLTQDDLRTWAGTSDYKRDFEGRVPYLGLAAYQWLVMRLGVDTIKPDIWLRRFVEATVGHRISDIELVRAFTEAAHRAGKSARELDAVIWERGALGVGL
jgi:hypothetical protein